MNSSSISSTRCFEIVNFIDGHKEYLGTNISGNYIYQLYTSCNAEWGMENSDRFSEPMVWIGIYIAAASFLCILAMSGDLLHGFRSKKFWFPCKYFTLNAASITVITVTMKLPVDLSSEMPSPLDQATKLGSLGFMCIMMANLMPSLASMDNQTLLANVIGLSILIITMIVNICIEINTSVISDYPRGFDYTFFDFVRVTYIYLAMIIVLLIITISSSLAIPASKEILDSKYQAINKIPLTDHSLKHIQMSTFEKLRRHVRRYWVIADTGSPQFVMASNPLSTTSGIICLVILLIKLYNLVMPILLYGGWPLMIYRSQYKWSTVAIYIIQSVGVMVGSIAPVVRCFSVFRFKLVIKWNKNHLMFFKVEKYWTQKLHEWKQSPIPFLSSSRGSRSLIYSSTNIILNLCIGFQKLIVISSKLVWLTSTIVPVFFIECIYGWKSFTAASRNDDIDEDLRDYVLRVDSKIFELGEKTLKDVSNSMSSFILKAAETQSNKLLNLLERSTGFKGVEIFDTDHVEPLLPVELINNWSLPIVTLMCIAVALPDIHWEFVESLFESVDEGLSYTHLVEESLNCESEYVNLRKTSMALWHEVEHKCKWLDNPLSKNVYKGKTTTEIIKWFSDKAKEIVTKINGSTDGEPMEKTLIVANSMYRITQTILSRYHSNTEPVSNKQLFAHLNDMIADIFCACFTNIPRVITMRCHESVIEKREASVKVAAKLLGKTMKIIERLETCGQVPSMEDDKMAYIDEWRRYFKQSIP